MRAGSLRGQHVPKGLAWDVRCSVVGTARLHGRERMHADRFGFEHYYTLT